MSIGSKGGPTIHVPWPYDRCILCLADAPLTVEHIIAEQIGGKLTVPFLCKPCNDRLGHGVEAFIKNDPTILLAVPQIPRLARAILHEQSHIGSGEGGVVRGQLKGGTFRVDSF